MPDYCYVNGKDLKVNDDVLVVHVPGTLDPLPAIVIDVGVMYIEIFYPNGVRRHDQFWAESGWRAWDGELSWRLALPEQESSTK